jgi:hypothetical protein
MKIQTPFGTFTLVKVHQSQWHHLKFTLIAAWDWLQDHRKSVLIFNSLLIGPLFLLPFGLPAAPLTFCLGVGIDLTLARWHTALP